MGMNHLYTIATSTFNYNQRAPLIRHQCDGEQRRSRIDVPQPFAIPQLGLACMSLTHTRSLRTR
jgi:hypothetical protein